MFKSSIARPQLFAEADMIVGRVRVGIIAMPNGKNAIINTRSRITKEKPVMSFVRELVNREKASNVTSQKPEIINSKVKNGTHLL